MAAVADSHRHLRERARGEASGGRAYHGHEKNYVLLTALQTYRTELARLTYEIWLRCVVGVRWRCVAVRGGVALLFAPA